MCCGQFTEIGWALTSYLVVIISCAPRGCEKVIVRTMRVSGEKGTGSQAGLTMAWEGRERRFCSGQWGVAGLRFSTPRLWLVWFEFAACWCQKREHWAFLFTCSAMGQGGGEWWVLKTVSKHQKWSQKLFITQCLLFLESLVTQILFTLGKWSLRFKKCR